MLELDSVPLKPQTQSFFLTRLPLEVREECYRAYLSTFETPYGVPYVDKDIYFLPILTGSNTHGHVWPEILHVASACRQILHELLSLLFREHAYLVDPDIDDQEWFDRTKQHIRRAAITFSVQAGKEKADLAKRRVRKLASCFEGGKYLRELGIHLWGRWRDATDPDGILQTVADSFKVPKVWVVDNHVLFGAQFFTNEQLRTLRECVEGRVTDPDWDAVNSRAAQRIQQMEEEAEEDPERHRLRKPHHSREASVASRESGKQAIEST